MSNLIEKLGVDYCNERVSGALFLNKDRPCKFLEAGRARNGSYYVTALAASGTAEDPVVDEVRIPAEEFPTWQALAHPRLGYRQMSNGRGLAYLTRRNSIMRGLSASDVVWEWHEVTNSCTRVFGYNMRHMQQGGSAIISVLKPQYTTLLEGLKKVRDLEIASFAMSPDFAVAPATGTDYLELLYRQRRVGTINEKGDITLTEVTVMPLLRAVNQD